METLILGDSIRKYQPTVLNDDHLLKIKVKCFPGINIAKLHKTLTPKLVSHDFILLHVGVNDFGYRSPQDTATAYRDLVADLQLLNSRYYITYRSI